MIPFANKKIGMKNKTVIHRRESESCNWQCSGFPFSKTSRHRAGSPLQPSRRETSHASDTQRQGSLIQNATGCLGIVQFIEEQTSFSSRRPLVWQRNMIGLLGKRQVLGSLNEGNLVENVFDSVLVDFESDEKVEVVTTHCDNC